MAWWTRAGRTPCWSCLASSVRVAMRFDGYRGVYLIHCHNLEHEDGGMMRNFEVE